MKTIKLANSQTIQSALKTAESGSTLILEPIVYREKLVVSTPNLTIKGVYGKTQIVYGDYANNTYKDGLEYNTFRTYTVCVEADGVSFEDITIENDAYSPKTKGQAVALTVYGNNFKGRNLILKSAQDTLFLGPLPDDLITRYDGFLPDSQRYAEGDLCSFFEGCKIYGSLDYIFGCGKSLFYDCEMINIDDNRSIGFVCAPAHSLKQDTGFTFYNCKFSKLNGFDSEIFLARPWRDYGKCTFINCRLGEHISPLGFDKWNDSYRNTTARFELFNCAVKSPVKWAKLISADSAQSNLDKFAFFKAIKL